jgi:hypothetical protein
MKHGNIENLNCIQRFCAIDFNLKRGNKLVYL